MYFLSVSTAFSWSNWYFFYVIKRLPETKNWHGSRGGKNYGNTYCGWTEGEKKLRMHKGKGKMLQAISFLNSGSISNDQSHKEKTTWSVRR